MPVNRFEIRNECSLADSELYRAADKDDPEALLEGVAMAGLVGILRQLGDLTEFAAAIFHNLHEEVMVTATRGHRLMVRVQQLEAEVPSIDRTFLSQTDHSSFFYHPGVDWHPNTQVDTNLVTHGDLPQFIMDSYEECRAPPRLFLLDKFDVAGAGACLKRYTDPSFFKVEMTDMTRADVQREKKILRPKKKGPQWRNGETREVIPTSHSKLHLLFMKEHVENGFNNHMQRVKLKRRLNGFPFDSKPGKSYMEKVLKSPSLDHKVLREVNANSLSPLLPERSEQNKSLVEVLEVRPMSPVRMKVETERSPHPSPDRKEIHPSLSIYESSEVTIDDQIRGLHNSYHNFATDDTSSAIDVVTAEKVIAADLDNITDSRLAGYKSNCIASEAENFVDATSTMETEMDTESDSRMKDDFTYLHVTSHLPLISDGNEEHHPVCITGCQSTGDSMISSTGDSMISNEENNSSKKEMSACSSTVSANCTEIEMDTEAESRMKDDVSAQHGTSQLLISDTNFEHPLWISYCQSTTGDSDEGTGPSRKGTFACSLSDSVCMSAENSKLEESSSRVSSAETHEKEIAGSSSYPENAGEDFSADQHSKTVICDDECTPTYSINNNHSFESEELTNLCCNKSLHTLMHTKSEEIVTQSISKNHEVDDIVTTLDNNEKKTDLLKDQPCHPLASGLELLSGDNAARLSDGKDPVNESNGDIIPSLSTVPYVNCNITDSSAARSLNVLDEDEPEEKNETIVENVVMACNMCSGFSQRLPLGNPISGELGDVFSKLLENLPSDYHDNGDDINSTVSQEESLINELHYEDSNASADAPNCSDVMEASLGEKVNETFLANAHTVDADKNCSPSSTQNLLLQQSNSPDGQYVELNADKEDVIHKQETLEDGISELESLASAADVVGLQGTGIMDCVPLNGSETWGRSFHTLESLEDQSGTSDTVVMDGTTQYMCSIAHEFTGICTFADLESPNDANILLDEPDSEGEKSLIDLACIAHVVELQAAGVTDNVSVDDYEALGSSLHTLENLDEPSGTSDLKEEITTLCVSSIIHEVSEICGSANQKSTNEDNKLLDEPDVEEEKSYIDFQPSVHVTDNDVTDNAHSYMDLHKVVDEHIHHLADSGLDEPENNNTYFLADNDGKSGLLEAEADTQTEATGSDSGAVFSNCVVGDQKSETSDVPSSHLDVEIDDRQESVAATSTQPLSEPSGSGTDHEFFKKSGLGNDDSDTKSFAAVYHAEEFNMQENPGLSTNQFDLKLSHSSEISPGSLPLLPITHLQMLDSDDHKKHSDSNPMISLVDCPNPPSVPELSRQSTYCNGVSSHHHKDPLCSIFLPFNPFSKANEKNLSDSPPLPPLPPVQWRMGKFQQHLAYTDGEIVKHKELPLQAIAPLDASTDDGRSSSVTTTTDDVSSFPVTTSADSIETFPQMTTSTDDVGSSQVMASADYVSSSPGEMTHSSLQELTNVPIQTAPEPASKVEEKISCSSLEIKDTSVIVDVATNVEEKQHQSVMPAPKNVLASPEEDGGVSQGIRTPKFQWPHNPLVEDLSVLDQKKLRKVTERVMPQIQKVGERDFFLEQIRNKSFNLKPAMAPRPAIQHPRTNLRVAAILEKATAIRQAMADSDDDSWSDS